MARISRAKAAQLWEDLSRAHGAMTTAIERDLVPEAGMPLAWYEVLLHVTRAPAGVLRFQELARIAGVTDSGASRRLEQMMRAGLIERLTCPTDRRGAYAHATERGQAAFERAHAVFMRSLDRHFGRHLKPDEANVLSDALARLSA